MNIALETGRPVGFARIARAAQLCASLADDEALCRKAAKRPDPMRLFYRMRAIHVADAERAKARCKRVAWFMARLAGKLALAGE